ncbi:hypothetical protein GCM10011401_22460 [Nesterenkonia cremea]|uniref:Uncharacterized protein n=1 Tax=Nesterenkonia cremea TaxID=1882340 RepID=A0A917AV53_9MICC|nr:hypothetical protein GCM10011401_22460 [Nesterenkonia cremea]
MRPRRNGNGGALVQREQSRQVFGARSLRILLVTYSLAGVSAHYPKLSSDICAVHTWEVII